MGYGGGWRPPQPPKKSSTPTLCIIGGAVGLLLLSVVWLQQAHHGFGAAALASLFVAGALLALVWGIAATANKKLPLAAIGAIAGVTVAALTGFGPSTSHAFCVADEEGRWEELTAAQDDATFDPNRWREEYTELVDEKYQRPQWRDHWMSARVAQAVRRDATADLRELIKEIDDASDPSVYTGARAKAVEAFEGYYDAAKARLYAPAEGGREFEVDAQLREAFAVVLHDLATASDANVYVAFDNAANMDPPPATEASLQLYNADPEVARTFPNGAPVLDPGQAFSPAYDRRRRGTFLAAMSESFGRVFEADLLELVPLETGDSHAGKIVIEVSSKIAREPDFFLWDKDDGGGNKRLAGLLFAVSVTWELRVVGRDGKVLYAPPPLETRPASEVSASTSPTDPNWAMYSIMMDSAYYNYARQITGRFGLVPPPVKQVFTYVGG